MGYRYLMARCLCLTLFFPSCAHRAMAPPSVDRGQSQLPLLRGQASQLLSQRGELVKFRIRSELPLSVFAFQILYRGINGCQAVPQCN